MLSSDSAPAPASPAVDVALSVLLRMCRTIYGGGGPDMACHKWSSGPVMAPDHLLRDRTTTVKLFQVRSRRWYELTNLPQPLSFPSAAICGSQLHVIGYDGDGYSCSLQGLPSSDQPITSQSISRIVTWSPLPRLPVKRSTAATLCGQLVIIGGKQGFSPVNSIHQLVDGQWVEIGSMSSGRYDCLVVSPSPDKMMIVSGVRDLPVSVNIVEECVVV